ncbi:hypothetical protein N8D56_06125 [Devosia sp. A8/3-2]|nr:hypothetical protein N8D56_06125 [Devosia sp. A8/3-2]
MESGNFTTYVGGDGMVGDDLLTGIDAAAVEGLIATRAGAPAGEATTTYIDLATAAGIEANATYAPVPMTPRSFWLWPSKRMARPTARASRPLCARLLPPPAKNPARRMDQGSRADQGRHRYRL